MNYLFYDSEAKESKAEKYFGLSSDMLDRSKIKEIVTNEVEREEIQILTNRIGMGLDDGEGGLILPDNYSCVIIDQEKPVGYIIAADYIREEDEDDVVEFEKIVFVEDITEQDRVRYFQNFLTRRNFQNNEDLDGLSFKPETLKQNPFIENVLRQTYPESQVKVDKAGLVIIIFER